jgi:hypothetical protein
MATTTRHFVDGSVVEAYSVANLESDLAPPPADANDLLPEAEVIRKYTDPATGVLTTKVSYGGGGAAST